MQQRARRTFILQVVAGSTALACGQAMAQQLKKMDETEKQAVTLGYTHDATKVDGKKWPKFVAGSSCSNCKAFIGKPGQEWGECSLIDDRMVKSTGWCSSYVKKA